MPRVLPSVKRRLEYDDISVVHVWWWRASTMMSASLRWSVWWLSSCVPAPSSPYGNCSRHDRFGSRTAQLRARWSSYVAQPSAVRLRWTQRCVRGAGASSGCYVDVARASTGAVCDTDKLPPNAPMVRADQHAHGRDSTRCGAWTFTRTPEHQSVGASGSAD